MKRLILIILIITGCTSSPKEIDEENLSKFLDQWESYDESFKASEMYNVPEIEIDSSNIDLEKDSLRFDGISLDSLLVLIDSLGIVDPDVASYIFTLPSDSIFVLSDSIGGDRLDSIFVSEPVVAVRETNKVFVELESYFGPLDDSDIDNLIELESKRLKKLPNIRLGRSSATVPKDTIVRRRYCLTYDDNDTSAFKAFSDRTRKLPTYKLRNYNIPISFNIISASSSNWVPNEDDIERQVLRLNQSFSKLNISFYTEEIIYHPSNIFWNKAFDNEKPGTPLHNDYIDMVTQIIPPIHDKIYVIVNDLDNLGQASFPWNKTYRTPQDNIIINKYSLPDIKDTVFGYYMQGETLVHEMGHFFGLYHIFHSDQRFYCDDPNFDGCNQGDYVSDTPPQKNCHYRGCGNCVNGLGCDECTINNSTCDTCTNDSEIDLVNNYMGYNPDTCMDSFTNGQLYRMNDYYLAYRIYLGNEYTNLY